MQTVTLKPTNALKKASVIHIGSGAVERISSLFDLSKYSKLCIVTDTNVKPLLLDKLVAVLPTEATVIVIPAGEHEKHIDNVQKIWTAMHQAGCDRKSLVINLGGGVIGDIGGFAASTYMRGVAFINVPTTLLAQVDASIGGKTGCNFSGIKNLVGTFSQPVGIVIDPEILAALPEREFVAGFAEIIKHGLIWDKDYFQQVTAKPPRQFTQSQLEAIISQSCQIKAEIVASDQTENDMRKLLNYGHTIGHAVEVLSHETVKPLLHGEAVSVGMRGEAIIAQRLGLIPSADLELIEQALSGAGLPLSVPEVKITDMLQKMQSDKKNDNGTMKFVLLDGIGRAVYDQQVPEAIVHEALQAVTKESS